VNGIEVRVGLQLKMGTPMLPMVESGWMKKLAPLQLTVVISSASNGREQMSAPRIVLRVDASMFQWAKANGCP